MTQVTLSEAAFEGLVRHLIKMEEGKEAVIEQLYPENTVERAEFEMFLERYIEKVEDLLKRTGKSSGTDVTVPFVTIDSEVEMFDLRAQETIAYRVANPFSDCVREGDVSYLSPVGRALLFKRRGEDVRVRAPGGLFRYRIKSIRLSNELLSS